VAHQLTEAHGVNNDYARKIIQRSNHTVLRLRGISLPRNERFLYLSNQERSNEFWLSLLKAFNSTQSVYGFAVNSLIARSGIAPLSQFGVFSGSPGRLKGHLSHEVVFKRLRDIGMLDTIGSVDWGDCIIFSDQTPWSNGNLHQLKARGIAEHILLEALADWVRKLGFGSYERVAIRGKQQQPEFGQFNWDLTAPSYLHPFVRFESHKAVPGFFVADVLLGTELTREQVGYFISKVEMMRRRRTTRPFLAMLVADHFAPEAFTQGKAHGIILTNPDVLLGKGISQAFRELISTLTNAAAAVVNNPAIIETLFSKLSAVEGAAINLRGPLFELLVACYFRRQGSVDVGYQVRDLDTHETAEIDVLVKKSSEVLCCECRGYTTNAISETAVREWLEIKVPRMRRYLLTQDAYKDFPLRFEFWTTGSFTPEAAQFLQAKQARITKYSIDWKDGQTVRKNVAMSREARLVNVLDEHYYRHPLPRALASVASRRVEVSEKLAKIVPAEI
jgi:hypothetical protein